MADLATFRNVLPMFVAVADGTVQTYLDMAGRTVDEEWGDDQDDAQIFLAAHLMSLAGIGPASQAGQLAGFSSIRAGSLSLSRAEKASAGEYAASQFGALYWRILQKRGGTGFGVTGTGYLVGDGPPYLPHGQG